MSHRPVNLRRWLTPGIGVKRWLLLTFVGCLVLALGAAHVIRQMTADLEPGGVVGTIIDLVTIQFLPYPLRGLLVLLAGAALIGYGALRTIRALTDPFLPSQRKRPGAFVTPGPRLRARMSVAGRHVRKG